MSDGAKNLVSREKRVPGRGKGMRKCPEARTSLIYPRNKKEDQGECSLANSMGSDAWRVER